MIRNSVSQDMYTIFKPNGLRSFDFNHNGKLDGLYISKEQAMNAVSTILELEQKALNAQAIVNQKQKERDSKTV